MPPTMQEKELRRFTRKYINTGPRGCWLWLNSTDRDGYGFFKLKGKTRLAHRVAYEHYVGPIPAGFELDHLCRHRGCVNPTHLEAVTHVENVRRGNAGKLEAAKTHCPKGHPYAGDNVERNRKGWRQCVTCRREYSRAYYARKVGAS